MRRYGKAFTTIATLPPGIMSAFQAASYGGNAQVVKLLLDAGANVSAQDREYSKALQAALCEGHE